MKILHIVTSLRGEESVSNKLGNSIIGKIKEQLPQSEVIVSNIAKTPFPHLEQGHLASFFTPEGERTEEMINSVSQSDDAIEKLLAADIIVMDVPMYNFTIPSTLKAWIDHITRAGVTFQYTANGVEGLVKNKKVYLAIASGGIYSEGAMKNIDFTENYLRNILGFIGIDDIMAYRVEGLAIPDIKEYALPKALKTVDELVIYK